MNGRKVLLQLGGEGMDGWDVGLEGGDGAVGELVGEGIRMFELVMGCVMWELRIEWGEGGVEGLGGGVGVVGTMGEVVWVEGG